MKILITSLLLLSFSTQAYDFCEAYKKAIQSDQNRIKEYESRYKNFLRLSKLVESWVKSDKNNLKFEKMSIDLMVDLQEAYDSKNKSRISKVEAKMENFYIKRMSEQGESKEHDLNNLKTEIRKIVKIITSLLQEKKNRKLLKTAMAENEERKALIELEQKEYRQYKSLAENYESLIKIYKGHIAYVTKKYSDCLLKNKEI